MELNLSKEEAAFRDEVRAFIAENYPAEMRVPNPGDRPFQGADAALASYSPQEGLDRAALAQGIWRARLDRSRNASSSSRRRRAPARCRHCVQRHHGGPGHLHLRQRRAEREVSAANPLRRGLVVPGLFGAGLRLRSRVSSAPRRYAMAITTSSMVTRPGRHWRSTPTGFSAWSAPIQQAKAQAGISFLLIDMRSPGVTVRPIITIDGVHEVNDVFLEDVRVPAGEPDRRGKQGLDLRKVPARQRAYQHGRDRPFDAVISSSSSRSCAPRSAPDDPTGANSPRKSRGSSSTCWRWRRPNCESSRRCRAATIRVRLLRCSRSAAPRSSSGSRI